MRLSNLASVTVVAAALGVAACAGGEGGFGGSYDPLPSSQTYSDNAFTGAEVGYASQFGPLPVYAAGGAADRGNLAALIDVLSRSRYTRELSFVPATSPSTS